MKIATKLTASQREAIAQLEADSHSGRVKLVTAATNNRVAVVLCCGDFDDITAFTYSLYVGKRGGVYETEYSDY